MSLRRIGQWAPAAGAAAVIQGVLFGLLLTVQDMHDGRGWTDVLPKTAVIAAGYAFFMWFVYRRQMGGDIDQICPDLTRDQRRVVKRAARRGSAPEDQQALAAAVRLVRRRLDLSLDHRTPLIVLVAALLIASVGAAIVTTSWWTAASIALAVLLAWLYLTPHQLVRRLELLGGLRT